MIFLFLSTQIQYQFCDDGTDTYFFILTFFFFSRKCQITFVMIGEKQRYKPFWHSSLSWHKFNINFVMMGEIKRYTHLYWYSLRCIDTEAQYQFSDDGTDTDLHIFCSVVKWPSVDDWGLNPGSDTGYSKVI